jgi:simple sugar transport system permease protein
VGENPAAADLLGINVLRVRYAAVAAGGSLAGLAGAYLSLVYRPSWTDGMTAGLGWIAVALVIFVGWSPLRAVFGAVFFGLLYYLQFRLQGQVAIPSEVFASLPYLLVILVLALSGLRGQQGNAPEALGKPYRRGER